MGKGNAPVQSPAEMLSMERASASRAASFPERTALFALFTFSEIVSVVSPCAFR